MKRFLAIALAATLGQFYAGTASADGTYSYTWDFSAGYDTGSEGLAANGIGTSRHNLGWFGEHVKTESTTEICVFCHTPHHSNTDAKPLWNRGGTDVTFKVYDSDGTTIAGSSTEVSIYSAACLTCHDGTTALDNIVNAPGKSGVTPGGKNRGWTFTECLGEVSCSMDWSGRLVIGDYGVAAYDEGAGLSNDHPIGVTYLGGQVASLRDEGTTIADINLTEDLETSVGAPQGSGSRWNAVTGNLWAAYGFINEDATISDMLRVGKVECTSCHDPHFNNKSWEDYDANGLNDYESNGLFLRRVGGNMGSGVCRTCHEK